MTSHVSAPAAIALHELEAGVAEESDDAVRVARLHLDHQAADVAGQRISGTPKNLQLTAVGVELHVCGAR